jgi:hypothetical protein
MHGRTSRAAVTFLSKPEADTSLQIEIAVVIDRILCRGVARQLQRLEAIGISSRLRRELLSWRLRFICPSNGSSRPSDSM